MEEGSSSPMEEKKPRGIEREAGCQEGQGHVHVVFRQEVYDRSMRGIECEGIRQLGSCCLQEKLNLHNFIHIDKIDGAGDSFDPFENVLNEGGDEAVVRVE